MMRFQPTPALAGGLLLLCLAAPSGAAGGQAPGTSGNLTPTAHLMSGKLYLQQKLWERAEEQFRLAVFGDSLNGNFRVFWGIGLSELGKYRLAETASIPGGPARLSAIAVLAPIFAEADRQFTRSAALDPEGSLRVSEDNRTHYWVELYKQAEALLRNRNYEESLEIFRLAMRLDPGEPQGFLFAAYALDHVGRTPEAVQLAVQARDLAGQRLAEARCDTLIDPGRRKDCEKLRRQHAAVIPAVDDFARSRNATMGDASFNAYRTAADSAEQRVHLEDAIHYYSRALELDPRLGRVRFRLGNASLALAETYNEPADTARAYPLYRQAATVFLDLADQDSLALDLRRDALFNAILGLSAMGEWGRLQPYLKRNIEMNPRDPEAYRRAAEGLVMQKKTTDAVPFLMMANALSERGDSLSAAESVQSARNLHPTGEIVQDLNDLGPPDEARAFRERESGRVIVTWIWAGRGEARHYIEGRRIGGVQFGGRKP